MMNAKGLNIELGSPGNTGITMVDLKIKLACPGDQVSLEGSCRPNPGMLLWNVDALMPNVHVRTAGSGVQWLWGRAYWLQTGIRGFWGGVVICRANVGAKPAEAPEALEGLIALIAQWRPAPSSRGAVASCIRCATEL